MGGSNSPAHSLWKSRGFVFVLRENLPGPVTVGPDREGLHILMEGAIGNGRNRLPAVRSLDADRRTARYPKRQEALYLYRHGAFSAKR